MVSETGGYSHWSCQTTLYFRSCKMHWTCMYPQPIFRRAIHRGDDSRELALAGRVLFMTFPCSADFDCVAVWHTTRLGIFSLISFPVAVLMGEFDININPLTTSYTVNNAWRSSKILSSNTASPLRIHCYVYMPKHCFGNESTLDHDDSGWSRNKPLPDPVLTQGPFLWLSKTSYM